MILLILTFRVHNLTHCRNNEIKMIMKNVNATAFFIRNYNLKKALTFQISQKPNVVLKVNHAFFFINVN